MKQYPWLKKLYNIIIQQHQIKKAHHAIFIRTQKGLSVFSLIWSISKWILCIQKKEKKYCNICHGCKLMDAKNHPDWHKFIIEKNNFIGIDNIRNINQKIFTSSKQGTSKIVFLSDTHKLTEQASNALLKTLEEPPKKTWFFLIDYNYLQPHSTLRSRCIIYKLLPPKEKYSLKWLNNENKKKNISNIISLRVNQLSPISAKNFIEGELWKERKILYEYLLKAIKEKNLLKILPIIYTKNTIFKIDWICFLLLDAIKISFHEKKQLINFDQFQLINFFVHNYNNIRLHQSITTWFQCRYKLLNIIGIDKELLLSEQILTWEKILNFIKIN